MPGVSRETADAFEFYKGEIVKWNRKINLVSPTTIADMQTRHIDDSLQLLRCVPDPRGIWCDLGSGGGLPLIPLAISCREQDLTFVGIESDARKAAFLRHIGTTLDLQLTVIDKRSEDTAPANADIVSARALAPLSQLLGLARRHGHDMTTYVFPKGENHPSEIEQAARDWTFRCDRIPSVTSDRSVILRIEDLHHV